MHDRCPGGATRHRWQNSVDSGTVDPMDRIVHTSPEKTTRSTSWSRSTRTTSPPGHRVIHASRDELAFEFERDSYRVREAMRLSFSARSVERTSRDENPRRLPSAERRSRSTSSSPAAVRQVEISIRAGAAPSSTTGSVLASSSLSPPTRRNAPRSRKAAASRSMLSASELGTRSMSLVNRSAPSNRVATPPTIRYSTPCRSNTSTTRRTSRTGGSSSSAVARCLVVRLDLRHRIHCRTMWTCEAFMTQVAPSADKRAAPGVPSPRQTSRRLASEWAMRDSNPRPLPCEGSALTN